MLVLARKTSETIVIGEGITLEILQIKGGQVRMGITAPADIKILRGELRPMVVEQNQESNEDVLCQEPSGQSNFACRNASKRKPQGSRQPNQYRNAQSPAGKNQIRQNRNGRARRVHVAGRGFPGKPQIVEVKIANVG